MPQWLDVGLPDIAFAKRCNSHKNDYKKIRQLFYFSVSNGVKFYKNKKGTWRYKNSILITPNDIKFSISSFDELIFSETFLYDIHFSDYDLDGKVVIQAGGFTGDTALYYANRGARVYSFEPDPNSYRIALENLKLNPKLAKRITFVNYAIGKDAIIKFPVNPENSGGSSVFSIKGFKTVNVRSVSIATLLKEFKIKSPYLLDLDIKGNEFYVINENILSKFKIIRIEYSTKINNKLIVKRDDILVKLRRHGFKVIRIYKHNCGSYDLIEHGTIEAKNICSEFFKV